jgi:dolichol-phosphate mannosyltransferase
MSVIDPNHDAANGLPLISVSIPAYNEADNIDALHSRLERLANLMASKCRLEFVFTDNHSTDATWEKLQDLARRDTKIRAIRFSKNFGFQRSIWANYLHTRGEAVLQIDADLQDPPELLNEFFEHWRNGYQVVYGIRHKRPESVMLQATRKLGYFLIDKLSDYPIPRDAGDFRLIDRKVINALMKFRTSNPYLRGMIAGMGFKQIGVPYDRNARTAGKSKFRLAQLVRLGLTGVFNHSVVPLRLATLAGLVILGITFLGSIYYIFLKLAHPNLPQGLASVHILVLFGIGFQSLLLGILGEYLLRIYLIVRSEPVAIVEDSLNFEPKELVL